MVRLLLMQRAARFSHIGTIVITRAALAADLLAAAHRTPARQEAWAHRPDVLPSSLGSFGNKKFSVMANRPVTITSCSFCNSRQGTPGESHRHHPSVPRTAARYDVIVTLFAKWPINLAFPENRPAKADSPRRLRGHHHLGQRPRSDRCPPVDARRHRLAR
jgi:hypothetical protein